MGSEAYGVFSSTQAAPGCLLLRCWCIAVVLLWYVMSILHRSQTSESLPLGVKYSHTFDILLRDLFFPDSLLLDAAAAAIFLF